MVQRTTGFSLGKAGRRDQAEREKRRRNVHGRIYGLNLPVSIVRFQPVHLFSADRRSYHAGILQ